MPLSPLAIYLRDELTRRGWTARELEARSGISDSTLGRLMSEQEARPSQIKKLADALGVPFEYVMERAGFPSGWPKTADEEARRIAAILAADPALKAFVERASRLSDEDRRAVLIAIETLLRRQNNSQSPPGAL